MPDDSPLPDDSPPQDVQVTCSGGITIPTVGAGNGE